MENYQKPLTEQAIKEAEEISITIGSYSPFEARKDQNWIQAFAWYNKHLHIGKYPLSMGCVPCFIKVRKALQQAKGLWPENAIKTQ